MLSKVSTWFKGGSLLCIYLKSKELCVQLREERSDTKGPQRSVEQIGEELWMLMP